MKPALLFVPNIEGYIVNAKQFIEYAHVELVEIKFKTVSNSKGYFKFNNVPKGIYTLRVSYMGKQTLEKKINVNQGVNLPINIVLNNSEELLNEVVVNGKKTAPIIKEESDYVARLPINNIENPQVYITVSKELMQTQLAIDLDAGLKNVVGAGVPIRYNQNRIVFYSRGFQVEPKIRNGLTTFNQNYIDPVNLERIEVLKGPSSTLFGSSGVSYGGLLNRVTKKPYDDFGGNITYSGGSWNLNRVTFDVNTPVGNSGEILFRINGAIHGEKSFQDAGFNNDIAFTPSITYKINPKTELYFDLEYTKTKGTSPVRLTPVTGDLPEISANDFIDYYKTSYTSNDMFFIGENIDIYGEIRHELSNNWISSTSFSRTQSLTDGYTSFIQGSQTELLGLVYIRDIIITILLIFSKILQENLILER